jgi:hypothetical protein
VERPVLFEQCNEQTNTLIDCFTGAFQQTAALHDMCLDALYDDNVASWIWFVTETINGNEQLILLMVDSVADDCVHIEHLVMHRWLCVTRGFWLALLLALDRNQLMATIPLNCTACAVEEPFRDWPLIAAGFVFDVNGTSLMRPPMLGDQSTLHAYTQRCVKLTIRILKDAEETPVSNNRSNSVSK